MKEVKKETKREVIDVRTLYVANDGTEFINEEECAKYEQTALCVLTSRVMTLVEGRANSAWELMGGEDEHKVIAIRIANEKDADTFLQWLFLEHPWLLKDSYKERKKEIETIVRDAYTSKDVILIGINYDGDYYFINSRKNIIDNLNKLSTDNKDTEK